MASERKDEESGKGKKGRGRAAAQPEAPQEEAKPERVEDPATNRKGIWEVTYESGAIIGYYEGTPRKIAACLIHRLSEGKYIKSLNFLYLTVQPVPDVLMKEECCEKRYTKHDNFCSRCGKPLRIDTKLPPKVKLNVSVPKKH